MAAETPGYILVVGGLDKGVSNVMNSIKDNQQLIVGFNRAPGQQDVTAKVDLTVLDTSVSDEGKVVRTKGDRTLEEFSSCVTDLLANIVRSSDKPK